MTYTSLTFTPELLTRKIMRFPRLCAVVRAFVALSALLLSARPATAQLIPYYSFTQNTTNGIYVPLTNPTVVASGTGLDEQRFAVTLPFPFDINGTGYTQGYINTNGYLSLGAADPGPNQYYVMSSTSSGFVALAGMSLNLASLNSTTELSYATLGTAPNRTFVLQWKNFGYPSSTALTANFQIRLQETTNTMTVVYGSCILLGSASSLSVQVGIRGTNNSVYFHRSSTSTSTPWTTTTARPPTRPASAIPTAMILSAA